MAIYDDAVTWLRRQAEGGRFSSKLQLAKYLKADPTQLNYTLDGNRVPKGDRLLAWLEKLGARVIFPDEAGPSVREVCFVKPQTTGVNGVVGPAPEDYLAVPLAAAPVAAGPGLIPEDKVRSWVLVWKHHESVRFRSNLVAVEIGRGERSMVPTLHPGDIVLVDREDKNPEPAGKIMLVTEPNEAGTAIKRVRTKELKNDIELIFYSDNAREFPPDTYRLNRDFDGEIAKAIAGRVVWAWADVTRK
jgi:hypothetical protein